MAVRIGVAMVHARAASVPGHELPVLARESADTRPNAVLTGLERCLAGNHLQSHLLAPIRGVGTAGDRSLGYRSCGHHAKGSDNETHCCFGGKCFYAASN